MTVPVVDDETRAAIVEAVVATSGRLRNAMTAVAAETSFAEYLAAAALLLGAIAGSTPLTPGGEQSASIVATWFNIGRMSAAMNGPAPSETLH